MGQSVARQFSWPFVIVLFSTRQTNPGEMHMLLMPYLQASLKPDAANQAASLMWGANLRQLASLLQSHAQSSTSAVSDAVMCEVYWLDKLSRFGEAQNLRDERARLLASRTNILDSLLGAMQVRFLLFGNQSIIPCLSLPERRVQATAVTQYSGSKCAVLATFAAAFGAWFSMITGGVT